MKTAACRRFARKMFGAACVTIALLLGWNAPAASAVKTALEVPEGASAAEVIDRLGQPKGMLAQDRRMTYLYDRGLIDFVDGRVVKAALVSPEEAERLKQQRRLAEEERRRQAEAARKLAASQGQAELQKRLADDQFAKSPPADRLAYWMDFSARHPDIDVTNQIAVAQAAAQAQRRQAERQTELMVLKGRVVEIQERFKRLDADYAASLANWKRNEIAAERAKLTLELDADQNRIREREGPVPAAEKTKTEPDTGM